MIREPYSSVRWLAEQRTAAAARWSAFASDSNTRQQQQQQQHSDLPLAAALAAELPAALRTPPMTEFDPEILELTGNEAVLDNEELPWSPMSLCHAFSRRRGFVRGGSPDTALAGQTILSMVLDGKLPYAVPPPDSTPVERQHTGTCGRIEEEKNEGEEEEEEEGEEDEEEDGNGAVLNPFSALGIEDGDDSDDEDEQRGVDSSSIAAAAEDEAGTGAAAVASSREKEKAGRGAQGGRRGGGAGLLYDAAGGGCRG